MAINIAEKKTPTFDEVLLDNMEFEVWETLVELHAQQLAAHMQANPPKVINIPTSVFELPTGKLF